MKKVVFDRSTFDDGMLRQLVGKVGVDRVMLGTDYPYDMGMETPVKFIDSVSRLSRADKDKIMGGNAARLLNIKS